MDKILLKEDFLILKDKHHYTLPAYRVENNELVREDKDVVEIRFVRGGKEPEVGTLHEHILSAMIHDLIGKYEEVPSVETHQMILKLKEALGWFRERTIDRTKRQVINTNKK